MWNYLVQYLGIKYIRKNVVIKIIQDGLLEEYLNAYTFKSGLADIIQLITAKELKAADFLTNDEKLKHDWKSISS